jgi:hypothetical protein
MPTRLRLTEEMIDLYRRGCEIEDEGSDEAWEDEGGRRREYLDIQNELAILIGREKPWQLSVFHAWEDDIPTRPDLYADWLIARDIRRALAEAVK